MANRFTQVLRPTDLSGIASFQPNFGAIEQTLNAQQQRIDVGRDIANQSFQALAPDKGRRDDIVSSQQESIDNVINIFKTQGIDRGNQELSQFLRDTRKLYSPGGEAAAIAGNFKAYQDYSQKLDKQTESGFTDQNTADRLRAISLARFKGTGELDFNSFSGINAAENVSLFDIADETLKGWKNIITEDEGWVRDGNGYMHVVTGERTSDADMQAAIAAAFEDPKVGAYLQQSLMLEEDTLGPLSTEERVLYLNKLVTNASNAAIAKHRVDKSTNKYFRDIFTIENYKHKLRKKEVRLKHQLEQDVSKFELLSKGVDVTMKRPSEEVTKNMSINLAAQAEDLRTDLIQKLGQKWAGSPEETLQSYKKGELDLTDLTPKQREGVERDLLTMEHVMNQQALYDARQEAAHDFAKTKTSFDPKANEENLKESFDKTIMDRFLSGHLLLQDDDDKLGIRLGENRSELLDANELAAAVANGDLTLETIEVVKGSGGRAGVLRKEHEHIVKYNGIEYKLDGNNPNDIVLATMFHNFNKDNNRSIDKYNDAVNEFYDKDYVRDFNTSKKTEALTDDENEYIQKSWEELLKDKQQHSQILQGALFMDEEERKALLNSNYELSPNVHFNYDSPGVGGQIYAFIPVQKLDNEGGKQGQPKTIMVPIEHVGTDNQRAMRYLYKTQRAGLISQAEAMDVKDKTPLPDGSMIRKINNKYTLQYTDHWGNEYLGVDQVNQAKDIERNALVRINAVNEIGDSKITMDQYGDLPRIFDKHHGKNRVQNIREELMYKFKLTAAQAAILTPTVE